MAVIYFRNNEWPMKTKAGVGIDMESKRCRSASQSVNYLKDQPLDAVITWGLQRAKEMDIVWRPLGFAQVGKE